MVADLQKEDDIKKLVSIATEKYKSIDVLVNNAASAAVSPFLQVMPHFIKVSKMQMPV